jgi:hypothetical protein
VRPELDGLDGVDGLEGKGAEEHVDAEETC